MPLLALLVVLAVTVLQQFLDTVDLCRRLFACTSSLASGAGGGAGGGTVGGGGTRAGLHLVCLLYKLASIHHAVLVFPGVVVVHDLVVITCSAHTRNQQEETQMKKHKCTGD